LCRVPPRTRILCVNSISGDTGSYRIRPSCTIQHRVLSEPCSVSTALSCCSGKGKPKLGYYRTDDCVRGTHSHSVNPQNAVPGKGMTADCATGGKTTTGSCGTFSCSGYAASCYHAQVQPDVTSAVTTPCPLIHMVAVLHVFSGHIKCAPNSGIVGNAAACRECQRMNTDRSGSAQIDKVCNWTGISCLENTFTAGRTSPRG